MRKLIMMAVAGYLLKKIQSRFMKRSYRVSQNRGY